VDGALTATGNAIVNIHGGMLTGSGTINGNVLMGGTITAGDPGIPGMLTINGNYEQTDDAMLDELIGPVSQSLLNINGDATLDHGALLDITLLDGFDPLGQTFDIMDFNSLTGRFMGGSSFWDDGYRWDVNYGPNQIDLTAVQALEPGTFALLSIGLIGLLIYSCRKPLSCLLRRRSSGCRSCS
jgi:hypothetical protein